MPEQAPDATAEPIVEVLSKPAVVALPVAVTDESRLERWFYGLLALGVTAGFLFTVLAYWVPGNSGVDQNGYLVGARMLAETLTMKMAPARLGSGEFDAHQFVGGMWVGTDYGLPTERFYPKYPIGLPALVAVCLWIGGDAWGPWLSYWINPLTGTLAVLATFLLLRMLTRASFFAFLGMLLFASSPVTLVLSNESNSHASCVFCVAWGMFLLLRWWQAGGKWRAMLAGLLLGYAVTIRYTEGTLLLPIGLVILFSMGQGNWRTKRWWTESPLLLVGWAIPVSLLVAYNYAAMGTITGYDPTNESTGFRLEYAIENWDTMLRHLSDTGLFLFFPVTLIGLVWMFFRDWKLASVLAGWIVPCLVVYTFYYWAPETSMVGYLRFFLTILPALAGVAAWAMAEAARLVRAATPKPLPRLATTLTIAALTVAAIGVHVRGATYEMEHRQQLPRLALVQSADEVLNVAPAGSVLFSADRSLMHHLQFVRNYVLYPWDTFDKGWVSRLPTMGPEPDEPQGLDPGRRQALYDRLNPYDQRQLEERQRQIMLEALSAGRRVFFVLPHRIDRDPPIRRRAHTPEAVARRTHEVIRRFVTPDHFDHEVVAVWNTLVPRPDLAGRNSRGRQPLRAPDRRSTFVQIVEVTKKAAPAAAVKG